MSAPAASGRLGRRIAAVLRGGTLVAVGAVATGFGIALLDGGPGLGPRPVTRVIGEAGGDALIGLGLLALTALPLAVLAVAAATFAAERERRYLLSSLATLGLLVLSLVTAAVLAGPS